MRYATLALAILAAVFPPASHAQDKSIENLAPYYETPQMVVDKMLTLADLKPGEKMFDLGSGDGRIVIMAAAKFKAQGAGVEFDPALVKLSTSRIKSLGLTSSATIIEGDLLKQDYSSADVITVYLLPFANAKLIPMLEKQLKPGARIVSHNAPFAPWVPVRVETVDDDGEGHAHKLYLYRR